jgi:transposase InsO family protein
MTSRTAWTAGAGLPSPGPAGFHYQGRWQGRGRVYDNIFIERLWRSVKYEEVFLHEYQTVAEAKKRLGEYFHFYNEERLHEALDYRTPSAVYFGTSASMMPTAAGTA